VPFARDSAIDFRTAIESLLRLSFRYGRAPAEWNRKLESRRSSIQDRSCAASRRSSRCENGKATLEMLQRLASQAIKKDGSGRGRRVFIMRSLSDVLGSQETTVAGSPSLSLSLFLSYSCISDISAPKCAAG